MRFRGATALIDRGNILIESVVAIGVVSICLMIITTTWQVQNRVLATARNQIRQTNQLNWIADCLCADIISARTISISSTQIELNPSPSITYSLSGKSLRRSVSGTSQTLSTFDITGTSFFPTKNGVSIVLRAPNMAMSRTCVQW